MSRMYAITHTLCMWYTKVVLIVLLVGILDPNNSRSRLYVDMCVTGMRDFQQKYLSGQRLFRTILDLKKEQEEPPKNELLAIMEWHLQKRGCPLEGYTGCTAEYKGSEWPSHERFVAETVSRIRAYGTRLSHDNWRVIAYALRVPDTSIYSAIMWNHMNRDSVCDALLWEDTMRAAYARFEWDEKARAIVDDVRKAMRWTRQTCECKF